jgi:hypothetical protein
MTPIDFDALAKSDNHDLYRTLRRHTGLDGGVHTVDVSKLPITPAAKFRLVQWAFFQHSKSVSSEPVAPPKPETQPAMVAAAAERVAREEAELKELKDKSRGIARLQQYVDEQGLEESSANLAAVQTFINEKVRGYWSQEIVDAAIQNLGPKGSNQLTWHRVEQPAPATPPPAEPTEVLEPWQLPIDADERTMKNASVKALQDLIARRRAATNQKYIRRGHAASF